MDTLKISNMAQHSLPYNQTGKISLSWFLVILLTLLIIVMGVMLFWYQGHNDNETQTITREGVITQIQQLNRLQTVAYSVDTVITSEKPGNWYTLWQDQQKGLFIAHGRVEAGIDLSKLTPEMVTVTPTSVQQADKTIASAHIDITLPPSEIFATYLDNIEVYDWQTGVFGMMKADSDVLNQAQTQGKREVLERACRGDIMNMAAINAQVQVQKLFELTGATVTVSNQGTGACHL